MACIDEFFAELGVPVQAEIPIATLNIWIINRCRVRKTKDDWGGLNALYRDFMAFQGHKFTLAAFKTSVEVAGYAVHRGMVSRLILEEDVKSWRHSCRAASASVPIL